MDRVEKSKEKYKQLFGDGVPAANATDPDFQEILSRFIYAISTPDSVAISEILIRPTKQIV